MKFVDIFTALYDYNSQHEEELTFKADDTLYILENDDSDWYKAQLKPKSAGEDGLIGLVPANYVQRAEAIGSITAIYTYTALAEEELSFTEDDAMVLYEKDDPDWFLAEKNGIFGLVPSNYVEESTSDATVTMTTTSPAEPVEEEQHEEPEKTSSNHHNNDEALSWSVHEYDVIKKKKTKAKGNLLVGNGMLCYGSETDKATPVRQFNTSQVSHVVCDGKHVHIDLTGNQTLDFYTASKSEAKSIMTKIDSSKLTTASASSTSLAAPSLASDQQSDISASFHSPAASFQSLPPQQQQLPEHPRAHSPLPPAPVEPEPVPQPQTPLCEAKWAIALYPFTPESSEETSLAQHEQVLVTDYVGSNDWWVIEHKDGKSGIVPASYVQFQDEFEAQTAKEEEEEELKKKKEQQEEIVRRQREEKQREEQQRLQEEQKRQEEGKKRKQEQDEVLKKQMEERERQRQQEEKEKARQIEVERRRKMQEEAKQKELDAKKMSNLAASAAAATASPQLGNNSPRRSQIPAPPPPPPVAKPPVAMTPPPTAAAATAAPVHNDPTRPDPSKLRTWTDNTGAFKVDAQLLSCNNGKIRLHKTNGVKIEVPVQKMCSADLRYIEKEIGIKLIEDKNDDIPLAHLTHGFTWYNFFKKLNLPLEASTRYAKAFENEGLGESDVERLTHRKMKSLGMSEKHVQRVQRFIETNVPEPPSDDERPRGGISTGKKKVKKTVTFGATSVIQDNFVGYDEVYNPADIQSQIQADEEYARQLQQQEEANTYSNQHHANGGLHRRGTGRPTPAHTAPRDVSTSAFSQFNISSEPLKPTPASVSSQPPLAPVAAATITAQSMTPPQSSSVPNSGFEDDAWAPRAANLSFTPSAPISHINPVQINNSSNSPLAQPPTQPLGQSLTLEQVNNTRPVPQIPGRQRPTPQSSQQNLVDPQLLAKWKGSPSLAAANTRPVPLPPAQNISSSASLSNQVSSSPNHANATAASVFAQQSQQQGGSGFFSSPANMSPATNIIQNGSMTPPPPPQMMGANVSLQPELQPVLVPNSVSPLSNQSTGLHPQIQQQPAGFGTPTMFNNVQSQQPTGFNPQYQQPTGFGAAGAQVQQPTGFGLQPQMTGYTQQAHQVAGMNTVPVSTQATGVPAAAFGPQSTGSSINSTWSNATPDNPFGISTPSPSMMQNSMNMNYHQNIPTGANPNDKYSVFKTVDANAPSVFNSNSQNNGAFQQGNYANQQGRW